MNKAVDSPPSTAPRVLLIQPRWMSAFQAGRSVQVWREMYPHAAFTLLAPMQNEAGWSDVVLWILPSRNWRALLGFLWRLRREHFEKVVVLTDAAQGDIAYGEAKFWALMARTRQREFNREPLTFGREIKAKRRLLILHAARLLARVFANLSQRKASSKSDLKSARTFVYLQYARQQHGAVPGRVLLRGTVWDEETARRCGWEIMQDGVANLALIQGRATLGVEAKLICYCGFDEAFIAERWRIVEEREAFFEDARDRWLVRG
jgi:hypothetical protein